jgi:bidirectional [NiFe] hydrogenase diaphorase subunit
MISIKVDDKYIEVSEGANLLQVCLENGVFIPNLCYLDGIAEPPASCRMCFVEIEGLEMPVAACSVRIHAPLVVSTATEQVRRLQRANLKLLLSVHHVDCRNCPANKKCELQRLAKFLKIALNSKPLENMLTQLQIDDTHPCFDYHPYRCVLCGRCVAVCRPGNGAPVLAFAKRGFDTIITSFGMSPDGEMPCEACTKCAGVCPVGALTLKPAGPNL